MKLLAEAGLWSTGPTVSPAPAVAVLEVSGAVLAWTVDDPSAAVRIEFTDILSAEWLWRLVGAAGHADVVKALSGAPPDGIEVAGIDLLPGPVSDLRRLALGHWLRRWWPTSAGDGIAGLDRSVLDGEVALLTSAAQDYFADDTFDSDVVELLAPHRSSLSAHELSGDPRVVDLTRACSELADEVGAWEQSESTVALENSTHRRRDDYALAAGAESGGPNATAIATGVGSVNWVAVPPGVFDSADRTIAWSIEIVGGSATAVVRVAPLAPASTAGIPVRVRSGGINGVATLDANGRATVPLVDGSELALAESPAWNHDWTSTAVSVGADVPDTAEAAATRQRIRDFARRRLVSPGADAFLAEILAAESDY